MRLALRWLARQCTIVAVSSLYRSEAVVLEGAEAGPDYLNAACEIATDLAPVDLLRFAKEIEHEIGRRPAGRWAPRAIDIDILLYGDVIVATQYVPIAPCRIIDTRNATPNSKLQAVCITGKPGGQLPSATLGKCA